MRIEIKLDAERLEELLRAAYQDGFEDRHNADADFEPIDWAESVSKDEFNALVQRVRDGKKP